MTLADALSHKTIWKIARWNSEEDKKTGKIYTKEEALRLFGVPQFTEFGPEKNIFKQIYILLKKAFHLLMGNALVNEGMNEVWTILCSSGGTKFDNTNAYLITGTGSGGEDPSDTEATFTSGVKKGMEATFPTYGTSQKATWKSVYGTGDANQAWNEFGVLNAASGGKLMNRKVSAQGTKTSGQTWELTLEITLS